MINRNGQSALEFLMTYGWTILAALVSLAAFWGIGVNRGYKKLFFKKFYFFFFFNINVFFCSVGIYMITHFFLKKGFFFLFFKKYFLYPNYPHPPKKQL